MKENNGLKIIDPRDCGTFSRFRYKICRDGGEEDCALYESNPFGNEDELKRVSCCCSCIKRQENFFDTEQPVQITRDENGKVIIVPYLEALQ
ncbi:MAG: hypothetical protein GTN36_05250 [Candidatus Aenigmarchaeota archaeon]|nr:hypothetical protein [Candidatus Aenigmarchaeota archaeon]